MLMRRQRSRHRHRHHDARQVAPGALFVSALSVFLNPDQVASTLFAGLKKLKIVTHCNNGSTYLRYLHQEFGIYKTYNLVSEYSFRVRMLNVTYRDIEGKRRDDVRLAFFIESDNEVARRLGMKKIKTKTIAPHQFAAAQTNIFELFQYLIANTDWAIKKGPGTENCCHNAKVIAKPDAQDNWVVLPYDFDGAGHHRNEIRVARRRPWNKDGASSTLPGSLPTQ